MNVPFEPFPLAVRVKSPSKRQLVRSISGVVPESVTAPVNSLPNMRKSSLLLLVMENVLLNKQRSTYSSSRPLEASIDTGEKIRRLLRYRSAAVLNVMLFRVMWPELNE